MIIVTGTVLARPDRVDELLALSQAHCRRSRHEPGCLSHSVFLDPEEPTRVVFLEKWESSSALHAHFRVPESSEFLRLAEPMMASRPEINIYEAELASI